MPTDSEGNTIQWLPRIQSDNLLHNPDGRISQRPSPATTADDSYGGPDRWYSLTETGTITATIGTGTGVPFCHKIIQAQAVAQLMGRAQIVEFIDCGVLQANNFVLSGLFYSTQDPMVAVLGWAGATNLVTSDVVLDWTSTDYTPGGFFISTVTVLGIEALTADPAAFVNFELTGFCPSSVGNIIVVFWTKETAAQNVELYFTAKLERGSQATEFLSPDPTIELLRCQRYYQVRAIDELTTNGRDTHAFTVDLPVPLRVSPTVTAGGFTNLNITGTPVVTALDGSVAQGFRSVKYSGVPTTNGLRTSINCNGTTLSADM